MQMNRNMVNTMQLTDQVTDSHRFIERSIPMLVHLQIGEALNAVMTQDNTTIKEF